MNTWTIWWFIRPSHVLLFAMAVGFLFSRRAAGRWLAGGAFAALLFAAFTPVGGWIMAPLENRFARPTLPPRVAGIIVLAGAERTHLTAARTLPHVNEFAERLTAFAALARRFPKAKIIHSGRGFTADSVGETPSSVARELLVSVGVDPQRLILEKRSLNTYQSAVELKKMIHTESDDPWLLVTSAMHMPRSVACFQAQQLTVTPYPVDYQTTTGAFPMSANAVANLRVLDLAAHEWIGLLYYRLRGYTDTLWP